MDWQRTSTEVATAVATAIAAKPLLEKLLGPSFAYVGKAMADLLERYGNIHVYDVFRRAALRLDAQLPPAHHVNARVLHGVIENAAFASDSIVREYLAGLLATSVSEGGEDDRAVTLLAIIRNMSSRQIRLHHLAYSLVRGVYASEDIPTDQSLSNATIFIPSSVLKSETGITTDLDRRAAVFGLEHQRLVGGVADPSAYAFMPRLDIGEVGVLLSASYAGAELFLWVHGAPNADAFAIFDPNLALINWDISESAVAGVHGRSAWRAQQTAVSLVYEALREANEGSDSQAKALRVSHAVERIRKKVAAELPRYTQHWLDSHRPTPAYHERYLKAVRSELTACLRTLTGHGGSRESQSSSPGA